jgi:CBL proto-oncogene N-terminus, EF hand-like domain/Zinc finger, C3HC4 type (RING finger)/SH2 domain
VARQAVLIKLYERDFLLKQRVDQFTTLFPTRDAPVAAPDQLIHDTQGRALWSTAFRNKLMVPWADFQARLESYMNVSLSDEEQVLRYYVDFARDGYVTAYELGVFLRWFGPLVGCVQRLMRSVSRGYLAGFVPACHASLLLQEQPPGAFLVRFSKTRPESFALTLVGRSGTTKHCLLYPAEPSGVTLGKPSTRFDSLHDFVSMNVDRLKYPVFYSPFGRAAGSGGGGGASALSAGSPGSTPASASASALSTVGGAENSAEEERRRAQAEQAVNRCVVCMDAMRDTVFLNCRHMVCCKVCAPRVSTCPMCRQRITEVLEVFRP